MLVVGLSSVIRSVDPRSYARRYFGLQAVAGMLWWLSVFSFDAIRSATLGTWDPALLVGPDLVFFVGASAGAAWLGSHRWAVVATSWSVLVVLALMWQALVHREAGWGVLCMTLAVVLSAAASLVMWLGVLPVQWLFFGPFAFSEAPENHSKARHLARSLAQLVVFWTTFLLALPLALAWFEDRARLSWSVLDDRWLGWFGIIVFLAGSVFGLWSCVSMATRGEGTPLPAETARKLVIVGPYRIVRNPMAVAGATQLVGVGIWAGSWLAAPAAFIGAGFWNTYIRPTEEADLAARFGASYEEYRSKVRCWVPRLR